MDALIRALRRIVFLSVSPVVAAVFVTPGTCLAGGPAHCHHGYWPFVDRSTICAWHRTWHGPNALATPLNGYFMPRPPAGCAYDGYAAGCGCGEVIGKSYVTMWPEGCDGELVCYGVPDCDSAALGLEPSGLERLGQVPNDLELAGGLAGERPSGPRR